MAAKRAMSRSMSLGGVIVPNPKDGDLPLLSTPMVSTSLAAFLKEKLVRSLQTDDDLALSVLLADYSEITDDGEVTDQVLKAMLASAPIEDYFRKLRDLDSETTPSLTRSDIMILIRHVKLVGGGRLVDADMLLVNVEVNRRVFKAEGFDRVNESPLNFALQHGSIKCVKQLLVHGVDPLRPGHLGRTGWHNAIVHDYVHPSNPSMVEVLAPYVRERESSDVFRPDGRGMTAIHLACRGGAYFVGNASPRPLVLETVVAHPGITPELIDAPIPRVSGGADPNPDKVAHRLFEDMAGVEWEASFEAIYGANPLLLCAFRGSWDCVKMLVAAGANPSSEDFCGEQILHCMASHSDIGGMLSALPWVGKKLGKEAVLAVGNEKSYGMSFMHIVMKNRAVDEESMLGVIDSVVTSGADVSIADLARMSASDGTPLIISALEALMPKVMTKLVESLDDGLAKDMLTFVDSRGRNACHLICMSPRDGEGVDTLNVLSEHLGEETYTNMLQCHDNDEMTPLCCAVIRDKKKTTSHILDTLPWKINFQRSPKRLVNVVHVAATHGALEIMEMLLKRCDGMFDHILRPDAAGQTPFYRAVLSCSYGCACLLSKHDSTIISQHASVGSAGDDNSGLPSTAVQLWATVEPTDDHNEMAEEFESVLFGHYDSLLRNASKATGAQSDLLQAFLAALRHHCTTKAHALAEYIQSNCPHVFQELEGCWDEVLMTCVDSCASNIMETILNAKLEDSSTRDAAITRTLMKGMIQPRRRFSTIAVAASSTISDIWRGLQLEDSFLHRPDRYTFQLYGVKIPGIREGVLLETLSSRLEHMGGAKTFGIPVVYFHKGPMMGWMRSIDYDRCLVLLHDHMIEESTLEGIDTPLHAAARRGYPSVLREILEKYSSPPLEVLNSLGETALQVIGQGYCDCGCEDCQYVPPDTEGTREDNTYTCCYCDECNFCCGNIGVPEQRYLEGVDPLELFASSSGRHFTQEHMECYTMLLARVENEEELLAKGGPNASNAMYLAIHAMSSPRSHGGEAFKGLLRVLNTCTYRAITDRNLYGRSVLHDACRLGYAGVVKDCIRTIFNEASKESNTSLLEPLRAKDDTDKRPFDYILSRRRKDLLLLWLRDERCPLVMGDDASLDSISLDPPEVSDARGSAFLHWLVRECKAHQEPPDLLELCEVVVRHPNRAITEFPDGPSAYHLAVDLGLLNVQRIMVSSHLERPWIPAVMFIHDVSDGPDTDTDDEARPMKEVTVSRRSNNRSMGSSDPWEMIDDTTRRNILKSKLDAKLQRTEHRADVRKAQTVSAAQRPPGLEYDFFDGGNDLHPSGSIDIEGSDLGNVEDDLVEDDEGLIGEPDPVGREESTAVEGLPERGDNILSTQMSFMSVKSEAGGISLRDDEMMFALCGSADAIRVLRGKRVTLNFDVNVPKEEGSHLYDSEVGLLEHVIRSRREDVLEQILLMMEEGLCSPGPLVQNCSGTGQVTMTQLAVQVDIEAWKQRESKNENGDNGEDKSGDSVESEEKEKDSCPLVRKLVEREFLNLRLSHRNADGLTALYMAVQAGHTTMAELLCTRSLPSFGIKDCYPKDRNDHILHLAIHKGMVEVVRLLVSSQSVSSNATRGDGELPLQHALNISKDFSSQMALVILSEENATIGSLDVNTPDLEGVPPMIRVILNNQTEVLKALLAREDINMDCRATRGEHADRQRSLVLAIEKEHDDDAALAIIEACMDNPRLEQLCNMGTEDDCAPLIKAVVKNRPKVVDALMRVPSIQFNCSIYGVHVLELAQGKRYPHGEQDDSVEKEAMDAMLGYNLACARAYLNAAVEKRMYGIRINDLGTDGYTAIIRSIEFEQTPIVLTLLKIPDIDINARDDQGRSPLELAISRENKDVTLAICNACLENGWTLHDPVSKQTKRLLLHDVAELGWTNVFEQLVKCMAKTRPACNYNHIDPESGLTLLSFLVQEPSKQAEATILFDAVSDSLDPNVDLAAQEAEGKERILVRLIRQSRASALKRYLALKTPPRLDVEVQYDMDFVMGMSAPAASKTATSVPRKSIVPGMGRRGMTGLYSMGSSARLLPVASESSQHSLGNATADHVDVDANYVDDANTDGEGETSPQSPSDADKGDERFEENGVSDASNEVEVKGDGDEEDGDLGLAREPEVEPEPEAPPVMTLVSLAMILCEPGYSAEPLHAMSCLTSLLEAGLVPGAKLDVDSLVPDGGDGLSPVLLAALRKWSKAVTLLVEQLGENSRSSVLFMATEGGLASTVRQIVEVMDDDINALHGDGPKGKTALMAAVSRGEEDLIEAIVSSPNIDHCTLNDAGDSALSLAIESGRDILLLTILKAKPETNLDNCRPGKNLWHVWENEWRKTSPGESDYNSRFWQTLQKMLEAVVRYRCTIDSATPVDGSGNTMLQIALKHRQLAVINLLLRMPNVTLDTTNSAGRTLMRDVIESEEEDTALQVLKLIHAQFPDIDPDKMVPEKGSWCVRRCIDRGWNNALGMMLKFGGIDAHSADERGSTALLASLSAESDQAALVLLHEAGSAGVDLNLRAMDDIGSAFVHAIDRKRADVLVPLLEASNEGDLDCVTPDGQTFLAMAVEKEAVDIVDLFGTVSARRASGRRGDDGLGMDRNIFHTGIGGTPLCRALKQTEKMFEAVLAVPGVDANARNGPEGYTPMVEAISGIANPDTQVSRVQALLRAQADPNIPGSEKDPRTPLMHALSGLDPIKPLVETLIRNPATKVGSILPFIYPAWVTSQNPTTMHLALTAILTAQKTVDVNITDNDDCGYIFAAIRMDHQDVLSHLLLYENIDVTVRTKDGNMTPLIYAVRMGRLECAKILLYSGPQRSARIDAQDDKGRTAVHYLVEGGEEDLEVLKKVVAPVYPHVKLNTLDHTPEGNTPLHLAVARMSIPFTMALFGFLVLQCNTKNRLGETALATILRHRGVMSGSTGGISEEANEYLTQFMFLGNKHCLRMRVTDADSKGMSPLHVAVKNEDLRALDHLMSFIPSPELDVLNNDGHTPFHMTIANSTPEAFFHLLKLSGEYYAPVDMNIRTRSPISSCRSLSSGDALIHLILKHPHWTKEQVQTSIAALLKACRGNTNEGMRLNPSLPDNQGATPTILASLQNMPDIGVHILETFQERCSIQAQYRGKNILQVSVDRKGGTCFPLLSQKVMEVLREYRTKVGQEGLTATVVRAVDSTGRSVLHMMAADRDVDLETAKEVLSLGVVLPNKQDKAGRSPFDICVVARNITVMELLLNRGDLNMNSIVPMLQRCHNRPSHSQRVVLAEKSLKKVFSQGPKIAAKKFFMYERGAPGSDGKAGPILSPLRIAMRLNNPNLFCYLAAIPPDHSITQQSEDEHPSSITKYDVQQDNMDAWHEVYGWYLRYREELKEIAQESMNDGPAEDGEKPRECRNESIAEDIGLGSSTIEEALAAARQVSIMSNLSSDDENELETEEKSHAWDMVFRMTQQALSHVILFDPNRVDALTGLTPIHRAVQAGDLTMAHALLQFPTISLEVPGPSTGCVCDRVPCVCVSEDLCPLSTAFKQEDIPMITLLLQHALMDDLEVSVRGIAAGGRTMIQYAVVHELADICEMLLRLDSVSRYAHTTPYVSLLGRDAIFAAVRHHVTVPNDRTCALLVLEAACRLSDPGLALGLSDMEILFSALLCDIPNPIKPCMSRILKNYRDGKHVSVSWPPALPIDIAYQPVSSTYDNLRVAALNTQETKEAAEPFTVQMIHDMLDHCTRLSSDACFISILDALGKDRVNLLNMPMTARIGSEMVIYCAQRNLPTHLKEILEQYPALASEKASSAVVDGPCALQLAIEHDNKTCAQLLLDNGVDVSYADSDGNTPLHVSIRLKRIDYTSMIIDGLHQLEAKEQITSADIANVVNLRNTLGRTPIFEFSRDSHITDQAAVIVQLLIDAGTKIAAIDRTGMTCLGEAARVGNYKLVEVLVRNGAQIDESAVSNDGFSILHHAVLSGDISIAKLLISSGAYLSTVNHKGDSVLDTVYSKIKANDDDSERYEILLRYLRVEAMSTCLPASILIVHCNGCKYHEFHTRHSEADHLRHVDFVTGVVEECYPGVAVQVQPMFEPGPGGQRLIRQEIPIGSFELYWTDHSGDAYNIFSSWANNGSTFPSKHVIQTVIDKAIIKQNRRHRPHDSDHLDPETDQPFGDRRRAESKITELESLAPLTNVFDTRPKAPGLADKKVIKWTATDVLAFLESHCDLTNPRDVKYYDYLGLTGEDLEKILKNTFNGITFVPKEMREKIRTTLPQFTAAVAQTTEAAEAAEEIANAMSSPPMRSTSMNMLQPYGRPRGSTFGNDAGAFKQPDRPVAPYGYRTAVFIGGRGMSETMVNLPQRPGGDGVHGNISADAAAFERWKEWLNATGGGLVHELTGAAATGPAVINLVNQVIPREAVGRPPRKTSNTADDPTNALLIVFVGRVYPGCGDVGPCLECVDENGGSSMLPLMWIITQIKERTMASHDHVCIVLDSCTDVDPWMGMPVRLEDTEKALSNVLPPPFKAGAPIEDIESDAAVSSGLNIALFKAAGLGRRLKKDIQKAKEEDASKSVQNPVIEIVESHIMFGEEEGQVPPGTFSSILVQGLFGKAIPRGPVDRRWMIPEDLTTYVKNKLMKSDVAGVLADPTHAGLFCYNKGPVVFDAPPRRPSGAGGMAVPPALIASFGEYSESQGGPPSGLD